MEFFRLGLFVHFGSRERAQRFDETHYSIDQARFGESKCYLYQLGIVLRRRHGEHGNGRSARAGHTETLRRSVSINK